MSQKILKIETNEQLEKEINEMISKGWQVDSIKIIDKFEVKMTKFSGNVQYSSSVPLLTYLEIRMLKLMCGRLGAKGYSNSSKSVLIAEIEKYKKSEIIEIYNELAKKNHGQKN